MRSAPARSNRDFSTDLALNAAALTPAADATATST